jgi:hypothetical protein
MNSNIVDTSEFEEELLDQITNALVALSNVGFGDYTSRLEITEGQNGAVAAHFEGLNGMIEYLDPE